jgi:hypothetical protein
VGWAEPAGQQRLQASRNKTCPASHDDLLTPAEYEAAQLLVTLAWRLDGGQLVNTDQMLARLCSIPTNDVAMAGIVLLRHVAHGVAPVLQQPPVEILDPLRAWLPAERGRPASAHSAWPMTNLLATGPVYEAFTEAFQYLGARLLS